jgi:hypothetical protein
MSHANHEDEPMFNIDADEKKHHDKAWSGDRWEIPVAVLLWEICVWVFLGGIRGVIVTAPFTIWVLLCLVLRLGLSVFVGACIMVVVTAVLFFLLFA